LLFLRFLTDKISKPRVYSQPYDPDALVIPQPPDPSGPRDPRDKQDRQGFFIEPTECVTCGCCDDPEVFRQWSEHLRDQDAYRARHVSHVTVKMIGQDDQ